MSFTKVKRIGIGKPKKTSIGHGKHSKWGHKGGGPNGSTTSKKYRKKPRGQG